MATKVHSQNTVSYPHQKANATQLIGLSKQLGKAIADCIKSISEQHEKILQKYAESKDKSLLSQGVWYPRDYAEHLRSDDPKQVGNKRYQWLRERNYLSAGYLDIKKFDSVKIMNVVQGYEFIIKKECLPSDALKAAIVGLSILDCGAVVTMARYKALLDVLGEKKFNHLFQGKLNIGYADNDLQPMRYFVNFTKGAKDAAINGRIGKIGHRYIQIGDAVSMNGVRTYFQKHPSGMDSNYNVVCSDATPGNQRFVGHGLPSKGATELEVYAIMIEEYNRNPGDIVRASNNQLPSEQQLAKEAEPYANSKIPLNNPEKQVIGLDPCSPQAFNVELVYDLVELPLEEISMEMVAKHPYATREYFPQISPYLNDTRGISIVQEKT